MNKGMKEHQRHKTAKGKKQRKAKGREAIAFCRSVHEPYKINKKNNKTLEVTKLQSYIRKY